MKPGIWQLLIVLVIVLILFGAKKLPELGSAMGKTIKGFKNSIKDTEEAFAEETAAPAEAAAPVAAAPVAAAPVAAAPVAAAEAAAAAAAAEAAAPANNQ